MVADLTFTSNLSNYLLYSDRSQEFEFDRNGFSAARDVFQTVRSDTTIPPWIHGSLNAFLIVLKPELLRSVASIVLMFFGSVVYMVSRLHVSLKSLTFRFLV